MITQVCVPPRDDMDVEDMSVQPYGTTYHISCETMALLHETRIFHLDFAI